MSTENLSAKQVELMLALPICDSSRAHWLDWRTARSLIGRGMAVHESGGLWLTAVGRAWVDGFRQGKVAAA